MCVTSKSSQDSSFHYCNRVAQPAEAKLVLTINIRSSDAWQVWRDLFAELCKKKNKKKKKKKKTNKERKDSRKAKKQKKKKKEKEK